MEKPPNPNKKDAIIILIDNFFDGILHTIFNPLVNSKIPEIIPLPNSVGIFNKLNIGFIELDKTSNNWLVCKIEIITENNSVARRVYSLFR